MSSQYSLRTDLISGILFLLLGVGILIYVQGFPNLQDGYPGPALFPGIVGGGLCLTGLALLLSSLRKRDKAFPLSLRRKPTLWVLLALLVVAIFPLAYPWLGFITSLGMVCLGIALLLGVNWKWAIPTAILTSLGIYGLFNLLLGVAL
jgi:putative tricarboxylic transport membrane protein